MMTEQSTSSYNNQNHVNVTVAEYKATPPNNNGGEYNNIKATTSGGTKDRMNHSQIWKVFEKSLVAEEAKCLLCSGTLAFRKSSTKGLWDHLKSKHKQEFAQLKQCEEVPATTPKARRKKPKIVNNVSATGAEGSGEQRLIAGMGNPQTELIRVRIQSNEHKPPAAIGAMNGEERVDSIEGQTSAANVAINHILVWSSICSQSPQPTFIMCTLLDNDHFGAHKATNSALTYALQKLSVKAEPSGCFSTGFPVNVVLDELSTLGYRAIGMVNKRSDEVLWTLAK